MKILFLTEFFPGNDKLIFTGGVEAYNYFLVKELSRKHKVMVICRNSLEKPTKTPYKIIRIGTRPKNIDTSFSTVFGRFLFLFQSINLGLREDFDLVQGNNFVTYIPAFIIAVLKKKPAIVWYPDVFIGKWVNLTGILSGLIGEIVERISLFLPWTHFVALSESTRNKLLKVGVEGKKISTIYAGVDSVFFRNVHTMKHKVFTVICISRLVNYKRIDILLKAVKILKAKGYFLKVYIIGDGLQKGQLLKLRERLGIQNFVSFEAGLPREVLAKRLKAAHLLCLPSEEEGFGLVVLEAAACGVPYIVSDLPVLKEVTKNGLGGGFFKKGSSKDLAEKIAEFIKSESLLVKKSKETVLLANYYSWDKIAEAFNLVYERVCKKPLRILMLIDAWFPHIGGGQVHVWELAKRLAVKGCRVTIFTRNLGNFNETVDGIEVIRVGYFKKFSNIFGRIEYLIYALIYSLISKYDIFHAHAFSPGLIAPFVKFFRGKPTVYTVHGRGLKVLGLAGDWSFLEDFVTYKIPYDLEITVARNTIIKKPTSKKLIVVPNGVDLEKFKPARRVRNRVKNMLYVGRLSYEKGVDMLVQAFKKLPNNRINLSIVGDGLEMGKIKKLSKDFKVRFKGRLAGAKLINEYRNADLLVLPSRTEGHPITLFEAWASKLPVLVTRVGDNDKYIKDGFNGFLTEPDLKSIREKLTRVMEIQSLNKIGENGYKEVNKYTWDKIAQKTRRAYQGIL